MGSSEYMLEGSPSLFGSTGLVGLVGNPSMQRPMVTYFIFRFSPARTPIRATLTLVKDELQLPSFALLVAELPLKVAQP